MSHVSLKIRLFNVPLNLRRLKKSFNIEAIGHVSSHTDRIYLMVGDVLLKVRTHEHQSRDKRSRRNTEAIFERNETLPNGVRYTRLNVFFGRDGERDVPVGALVTPDFEISKTRQKFSAHTFPSLGMYYDIVGGNEHFVECQLDCTDETKLASAEKLKDIMDKFGFPKAHYTSAPYHRMPH